MSAVRPPVGARTAARQGEASPVSPGGRVLAGARRIGVRGVAHAAATLGLATLMLSAPLAHATSVTLRPGAQSEIHCPPDALRSQRKPAASEPSGHAPRLSGAPFRVALWGDSHTAAPAFVEGMMQALRLDPQASLPSFVAASWGLKGVAQPLRAACASTAWRSALAYQGARAVGAGLVSLSTEQADSVLAWDFRWPTPSSRLRGASLHLSKDDPARRLLLGLSADGGPEALVAVEGRGEDALHIELEQPAASLRLRVIAGQLTVHGIAPRYAERAQSHVDVFSLPGATVEGWRHADLSAVPFAASKPALDLAILQYGTNDAPGFAKSPEEFTTALRASLRQFRLAYPGTRCVLIGAPDRGGRARDREHSLIHFQVTRVQSQLAHDHGCEFWNWQAAMGGLRSASQGLARKPPTMQADLIHLTDLGYREGGMAFGSWAGKFRPQGQAR